ncbi:MAG TPA: PAS domain S-box protein, partial [Anaerolineae bacterium]|nr:PAS domain S-box protein [Anaerolineae bacterium]
MTKRDRELKQRLEELFSSEAELPPPADANPIDAAGSAPPIESMARALAVLPPDLWKTILDQLPLPVYLKDREHTWVAVNSACGDLLGRLPAMLIGHVDKEQPDEAWQLDDQVLETNQPGDTQVSTTALDGTIYIRRTRRVPLSIADRDAQARYVLGIIEELQPDPAWGGTVKPGAADQATGVPALDNSQLLRFQAIVEATPIPILITRAADGRPLYVNARAGVMFGVAREDLLNHTTLEFYDDAADRQKILGLLQQAGRVTNYELRLKRGDGSIMWVILDMQPMVYNNERAVLSGFYDITARKQGEEKLRYSEALYQSLIDTIPENLCRKDEHGRFTYGNRHFRELVGLSLEELIGKTDFDMYPPDLAKKYRADDQAVMAGGKAVEFLEAHVVPGTDEQKFVRTVKNPLYDAQGQLIGLQFMFWDVTEQARADQALRLRTSALEAAANGVTITDRTGQIIWVNPAFTQVTGYAFEEAVGQNPRILKSGRQPNEVYRDMWQRISSGQNWHGELVNRRKDGREYDEEITITPVRSVGNEITHYVAVTQDITARKQTERR